MSDIISKFDSYLIWFLSGIVGWVWWSFRRNFVEKIEFEKIKLRVSQLEIHVSNGPTKDDFHKLILTVEKLSGSVNTVTEIVKRMEKIQDLQQEYLLKEKKK